MDRMRLLTALLVPLLIGCTTVMEADQEPDWSDVDPPSLTPASETLFDLIEMPPPAGRIPAAVYRFSDQTGQFRSGGQNNFSTAVTQGAGSLLTSALVESEWFRPLEREGLQDLLTERRILRQVQDQVPSLREARLIFEGGIIAYETNITTGGAGARYFGIGSNEEYRIDQVMVNLRAVDVNSGEILASVDTTKTVYSHKIEGDIFRFVRDQRLLEAEAGYTRNEPRYLATRDAIYSALVHLIVQGIANNHWRLEDDDDVDHPIIQAYWQEHMNRRDRNSAIEDDS